MERKLRATPREANGKGGARKLRAAGQVPAILYGHGMAPVPVAVDSRELFHIMHTGAGANVLIDLEVGSDKHLTLPREVQRDHVRGSFLHVDFLVVRRDQAIHVEVPIELVGESHGVKEGGVVEHHLWELRVECLPGDVPERLEADISALGIGDALRVTDVKVPRGVTILTEPEETVVSVVPPPILQLEEEVEAEEAEAVEGEEAAAEAEGATGEEAAEHAESEEGGEEG